MSPGTTLRLNRTLSMPPKKASLPLYSGWLRISDRAGLGHRFDDQDARHDRKSGKMPAKEIFFAGNMLVGDDL